jgi:pimeloyl-ACP methyl ester carboxylesterase
MPIRVCRAALWVALGLVCLTDASANGLEQERPGVAIAGLPLERREIRDDLGRDVTYYISHPKKPKAPILLMIQGSGCDPVIVEQPAGSYSTLFDLLPFAAEGEFTVVAVEKPFSGMASGRSGGTAVPCGAQFNADFTAERWMAALQSALHDARKSPWVDGRRTLIFGFSEGAVMADLLAGRDDSVTDVIAIGGSGTTQLFDFVALTYRRGFDTSVGLADIERNVEAINANPDSSTQFAWGHPYKRWSSFFRIDPGAELLRSKARVYIAFGTADESTPALSEEVAIARLRLAGRDVTVRRVPNAGHSLSDSVRTNYQDMDKEFRAALAWFWRNGG